MRESRKFVLQSAKKRGKKLVTICSVARQSKRNYVERRSDWGGPPLLSLAERPEYLSRNRSREFRRSNWPSKGSQFGMLGEQGFFLVKIHGRQFLHAVPIYQTIRVTVVPKWNTISIRQASSQQLCCTTVEPWLRVSWPSFFDIALNRILFYQRYYCDRGRKSARCFKLLQFDSGPFVFLFFSPSLSVSLSLSRWSRSARFNVRSEYGYLVISGKLRMCGWNNR